MQYMPGRDLAEGAVCCEPCSPGNSLYQGKIQGYSATVTTNCGSFFKIMEQIQSFVAVGGPENNRVFPELITVFGCDIRENHAFLAPQANSS